MTVAKPAQPTPEPANNGQDALQIGPADLHAVAVTPSAVRVRGSGAEHPQSSLATHPPTSLTTLWRTVA